VVWRLTKSLLSVKSMMKQCCEVCFKGNKVECLVPGKVIVVGKLYGNFFSDNTTNEKMYVRCSKQY
jgi:hypothetical protein